MTYHLRTLSIICRHLRLGRGNRAWLTGGTGARLTFVMAAEIVRLFIAQTGRRFLDGGTITQ